MARRKKEAKQLYICNARLIDCRSCSDDCHHAAPHNTASPFSEAEIVPWCAKRLSCDVAVGYREDATTLTECIPFAENMKLVEARESWFEEYAEHNFEDDEEDDS